LAFSKYRSDKSRSDAAVRSSFFASDLSVFASLRLRLAGARLDSRVSTEAQRDEGGPPAERSAWLAFG